jgi:hypothetical protein
LTLLYETKQYNRLLPCHYLVADAQGNAFVWEREQHNVDRVTPAGDAPMCVTNHPLYRYPDVDQLPTDDELSAAAGMPVYRFNTYARMRMLTERAAHMPLSSADLADAVDEIAVDAEVPTARTIWRSLFDLDARTIEVEFFLGDEPDGRARRSPPRAFSLT